MLKHLVIGAVINDLMTLAFYEQMEELESL